ncbi:hypothetical protein HHK36_024428 [Tetracentron sinense]|uniref:Uncharacterized protein n=1 Tax=Tetracentron sinense TaxID=13715 RepID=A0A834YN47_TETSI|nr:hypothetical protein HHK36_024428 [Tetracentron sinense]
MDFVSSSEHLCYVRCNFCNTVLAVGIPCKPLLDTVTVKCGHCSNLSFLSTRPPLQGQCLDHQMGFQGFCSDYRKGQSSSSSSSTPGEQMSPRAPFVVKPPEKKHRLPSAYNRFMKEEIQRIKEANPEIPHREAFSTAAKNWARYVPHAPAGSISGSNKNAEEIPQALVVMSITDPNDPEWNPDTGATSHMTNNPGILRSISPYTGSDKIVVGNGNALPISRIGSTILPTSYGKLTVETVLFTSDGFVIKDQQSGQILAKGTRDGGFYTLTGSTTNKAFYSSRQRKTLEDLWH